METSEQECRFFCSYTGVKLPFNLANPIAREALSSRNTFIRALFTWDGRLKSFDKVVYGEVELSHRYVYYDSGTLRSAEITMLYDDAVILFFDEKGNQL